MLSHQQTLNAEEQTVLDIISNHRALISIVFDMDWFNANGDEPQIDYQSIDKDYLDQIANPTKNRPSRSANFFADMNKSRPDVIKKMDMRTGEVYEYNPGTCRETKHKGVEFQHTAKTATSLIPPDPRYMELFQCDYGIGFLWDINDCNIKEEKYVFPENAGTNGCFWFDLDTDEKIAELRERIKQGGVTTIAGLREINNAAIKHDKPIAWNEILVGLPKNDSENKLRAVFATQDERSVRLRALRAMLHVKEKLNLKNDFPVFILQPFYAADEEQTSHERPAVFRFYSQEEREVDLQSVLAENKAGETALEVIKNHNALALTISDDENLKYYLDQLADPTTNRPSLSKAFFEKQGIPRPNVIKKINLKNFDVQDYNPGQCRETKHKDVNFMHTAKIATTLLPREPQWMNIVENDNSMEFGCVGLLFNAEECNLKDEKYVFPHSENMNECFWLDVNNEDKLTALKKRFENESIGSLDALRAQNDKAISEQTVISSNTVLAGLPKGKVTGVFCLVNRLDLGNCYIHCVQAQNIAAQVKEKFKLEHVPIFLIQPASEGIKAAFRLYGGDEQFYHKLVVDQQINQQLLNTFSVKDNERKKLFTQLFSRDNDIEDFVLVEKDNVEKDNKDNTEKTSPGYWSTCSMM